MTDKTTGPLRQTEGVSDEEIKARHQSLRENSDKAAEAAKQAGVTLHPRIAKLQERQA